MKEYKSKFGEGIGGPVQNVVDPNAPSYDPAQNESADMKVSWLLADERKRHLQDREIKFLLSVYGLGRLTRKQHIWLNDIYKNVRAIVGPSLLDKR